MGTYGRNFGFRIVPESRNRKGRFAAPATGSRLPIGVPVVADTAAGTTSLTAYPTQNVQTVKLATGAQAPVEGQSGILVYEYGPAAFAGFDPALTLYSDLDTVPLGANVQLVNGPNVKVLLKNTRRRPSCMSVTTPPETWLPVYRRHAVRFGRVLPNPRYR